MTNYAEWFIYLLANIEFKEVIILKRMEQYLSFLPIYLLIICTIIFLAVGWSKVITVMTENAPIPGIRTIVIDAGHGGVDGGATSCTGILESQYNLEIAMRLNDLLHFMGYRTIMIRDGDYSVYTEGETIAQKKVSDLKERVRIVNSSDCSLLVSIHQNYFQQSQYNGAQVFYAPTEGSERIARELQTAFTSTLNINSNRKIKKAENVYVMQHIRCPGVLVECGFLSNYEEAYLLSQEKYQQNLCSVIACAIDCALNDT